MAGGFFSPVSAFVTGFANQANENIERQKLEDRENDLIWANKFEKGKAEYEKERKEASEKTGFYNTLLQTFKGDQKAADMAFQIAKQNPKNTLQAISWVAENIKPGENSNYQSTSLSDIQNNLSTRYQNLEELKGSARQGNLLRSGNTYAGNMQMPMAPNSMQPQGQQQPSSPTSQPGQFTPPTSTPQPATSNQPIGMTSPGNITSTASISNTPVKVGSGALDTSIGNAPSSGPPISLDSPSPGYTSAGPEKMQAVPTPAPAASSISPVLQSPAPTGPVDPLLTDMPPGQTTTAPPNAFGLTPYRTPESMAQQKLAEDRDRNFWLAYKKYKLDESRHPDSPEVAANLSAGNKVAVDFFNDNKNGIEANHKNLVDAQALRYDVNGMMEMLNKGFQAKTGQEVIDNINKITAPYLGLDLSQMAWANSVKDANLMRKYVANALIDRLKTMHFGRITNYTERMTLMGMPGSNNDPDTNVRIVLALQDTLKSALEVNERVQNAVYTRENMEALKKSSKDGGKTWVDLMFDAKLAAKEYNDKYLQKQEPFESLTDLQKATKFEPGTWFENKNDHKMYRFLGVENGMMRLQDAGSVQNGLPEFYNVPVAK